MGSPGIIGAGVGIGQFLKLVGNCLQRQSADRDLDHVKSQARKSGSFNINIAARTSQQKHQTIKRWSSHINMFSFLVVIHRRCWGFRLNYGRALRNRNRRRRLFPVQCERLIGGKGHPFPLSLRLFSSCCLFIVHNIRERLFLWLRRSWGLTSRPRLTEHKVWSVSEFACSKAVAKPFQANNLTLIACSLGKPLH